MLKFVGIFAQIHLLFDAFDQNPLTLLRILYMLFLYLISQVLYNGHGGLDPQISHDQSLLDLLIKIIINGRKTAENRINS